MRVSLNETNEEQFLDFLNRDRVLHFFTIYDLKYLRDKTQVWIALDDGKVRGYVFEFDERIVHTHGDIESIANLMDCINVVEPVFVIEPDHLDAVKEVFTPDEPTDQASKHKVTTYLVVSTDAETFHPSIRHTVKKLGTEDLDEVLEQMGDEKRMRVETAIDRGIAFGAYDNNRLVSVITASEILDDLALIRGTYTVPQWRGKGFATSVCSALVEELLRLEKLAVLWVAKDNHPARKVYEKIGFKRTGHTLLGFKAKRKKH